MKKKRRGKKCYTELRTYVISLEELKQQKMVMRSGTWNVRSPYGSGRWNNMKMDLKIIELGRGRGGGAHGLDSSGSGYELF
jgi:hypothetical protein